MLSQGTEKFPRENEYSEVRIFCTFHARTASTPAVVPCEKQRSIECIYRHIQYQLLLQRRDTIP